MYFTGFEGDTCETNIDNCVGIVCGNGGTCVDGVAQSFCHCTFGNSGPTCNKGGFTLRCTMYMCSLCTVRYISQQLLLPFSDSNNFQKN